VPKAPGIEPAQRAARAHDVRRGAHEVAAVGDQHAVVWKRGVDLATEPQRVHALPADGGALGDVRLAGLVARSQFRKPLGALRRRRRVIDLREVAQAQSRIGQQAVVGLAVEVQLAPAEVE
jgi:hypothetical protein